jgi:hypothetical protein
MQPSAAEQIDLWRYAYARSSMNEAKATFEILISDKDLGRDIRRGLLYAAIVCYARPFTAWQVTPSKRVVPLKDAPAVPDDLRITHNDYLELRNKVVGHKDATPGPGRDGHPNVVLLDIDDKGFNLHTIEFDVSDSVLRELISLATLFITHCEAKLIPLMDKIKPELKALPVGTYLVTPAEPPEPWIRLAPALK